MTLWSLYDTGYTERYMGQPQSNSQGYKSASVLNYVDQFPDESVSHSLQFVFMNLIVTNLSSWF